MSTKRYEIEITHEGGADLGVALKEAETDPVLLAEIKRLDGYIAGIIQTGIISRASLDKRIIRLESLHNKQDERLCALESANSDERITELEAAYAPLSMVQALHNIQADKNESFEQRLTKLEAASTPEPESIPEPEPTPEPEPEPEGRQWYVSRFSRNQDGKTWATAWNEMDQINWDVIQPGDTIVIGEGDFHTPLFTGKSGTVEKPITICRDMPTSSVTRMYGQVKIWHEHIVFDGGDPDKFIVYPTDSMCGFFVGYWPDTGHNATGAFIQNITLEGNYDTQRGVSMSVYSEAVGLSNVKFIRSPGEDQLKLLASDVVVDGCDFSGQVDSGTDVHRDVIALYNVPVQGQTLAIMDCYFHDSVTDTIGVFPTAGVKLGIIRICDNTWWNVDTCIKFDSSRIASIEAALVEGNRYGQVSNWLVKNAEMANLVEDSNTEITERPEL